MRAGYASTLSASALDALGEALRGCDYTSASILRALHEEPGARPAHISVYERRLAEPTALNLFIKLFTLGVPVSVADAERVLPPGPVAAMLDGGLVERDSDLLTPLLAITHFDGFYVIHDRIPEDRPPSRDFVLGPNPSAGTLASLTPRPRVHLTLDLCCGSGIQALYAARHSDHVIATDINPRALELARLTAALNAVSNLEWRQGSLFEPVAGLEFDLIVANPPFIISPDATFMWRDGGLPGGGLCLQLLRDLPSFMAPSGFAALLLNWPRRSAESWDAPLRRWLGTPPCDAWLLHSQSWDPLAYAAQWTRPEAERDRRATLQRWLGFYEAEGIERLDFGALLLRRRAGSPGWTRTDELPSSRIDPCGPQLVRAFENYDRLQHLPDEALLSLRVRVPDGYRLEQQARVAGGQWTIEQLTLVPAPGIRFLGTLDASAAEFVFSCDGYRTVREALVHAGQVDAGAALPAIRRMLSVGSLEFLDAPGSPHPASNSSTEGDSA